MFASLYDSSVFVPCNYCYLAFSSLPFVSEFFVEFILSFFCSICLYAKYVLCFCMKDKPCGESAGSYIALRENIYINY